MRLIENKQDLTLKKTLLYISVIAAALLFSNCSEDTIVEPDIFEGEISGQVKFIDGSPGAFARVNLQDLSNIEQLQTLPIKTERSISAI